jgi:hypothetical protein
VLLLAGRPAKRPGIIEPCIPTLASKPPVGRQWIHEIKHDGCRLIARKRDGRVRLFAIDPARARSGSRSRIRRPQAFCDLRIGLERAAKSSPLDGPHGHARRVRYLGIKRHRATCPAPRDDSTGAGNRAQIAKCVGYDDGDIHRLSTARFARKFDPECLAPASERVDTLLLHRVESPKCWRTIRLAPQGPSKAIGRGLTRLAALGLLPVELRRGTGTSPTRWPKPRHGKGPPPRFARKQGDFPIKTGRRFRHEWAITERD